MATYYKLGMDEKAWPFWFLNAPKTLDGVELNPEIFSSSRKYNNQWPLTIVPDWNGPEISFNFGSFDMLVVSKSVGSVLKDICGDEIQRIPVDVVDAEDDYEILNVLEVAHCLDEEKSKVMYWTPKDGRPDKIGSYRMIIDTTIIAERTKGLKIFQLGSWVSVIVHDDVRSGLEACGVTGCKFTPVG